VQPSATEPLEEESEEAPPDRHLERIEEIDKLLSKLAGRDREVVRLFYVEGRSYEEISTRLNIPVNTIGPILSRARKKLSKPGSPPMRRDAKTEATES
jgi:RNA polymerase sigma-70 factor (ECF subfamily)